MIDRHHHLVAGERELCSELEVKKYSLVYYLKVGDQKSSNPGILKLYEPSKDILPKEGMVIIFPSDREHSTIYDGNKDRIIIGINFYCI